jgi:hypothetical protein
MSSKRILAHTGHQPRPDVSPECIHCLGSGWLLDPTEDDEDRTFPCHMCCDREDTLDAQHSCLERMDD